MIKWLLSCVFAISVVATASSQETSCNANLRSFNKLKAGMSYSQAVAIIGCDGSEMSRSEMAGYITVMYMWSDGLMGNMNAMFQNDKLVSKAQFGLR